MYHGIEKTLTSGPTQHAPPQSAFDPEDTKTANEAFPWTGQQKQRTNYLLGQQGARKTQQNALELQQEKNKGLEAVGGMRRDATIGAAQTRADTSSENNKRTVAERLQAVAMQQQNGNLRSQQAELIKTMDARIAASPGLANDSAALLKAVAPVAIQLGLNPQKVAQAYQQQQAQQPSQQSDTPAPAQKPGQKVVTFPSGPYAGKPMIQLPNGHYMTMEGQLVGE